MDRLESFGKGALQRHGNMTIHSGQFPRLTAILAKHLNEHFWGSTAHAVAWIERNLIVDCHGCGRRYQTPDMIMRDSLASLGTGTLKDIGRRFTVECDRCGNANMRCSYRQTVARRLWHWLSSRGARQ